MSRDMFLIPVASVPVPDPPTGLRAAQLSRQTISLWWDEKTSEGHEAYRVYHSTDDDSYTRLNTQSGESFTERDLDPGTHYFKVTAVNTSAMESDLSSAVSVVMAAPSVPAGLRITRLVGRSLRLEWNEATPSQGKDGFEGYEAHHSTDDSTYTLLESVTGQAYIHRNLSPATHYYKVRTLANGAESALSAASSAVVAAPATPGGLRLFRTAGQSLQVRWNEATPATAEYGFEGYNLYHRKNDDEYSLLFQTKGKLSIQLGLEPATHYYKVSTLANGAESAQSEAVSLLIADPIPYTTTDTVAIAGVKEEIHLETALGRKATNGTLICTGPGVLIVEMCYDGGGPGATWTDPMELRPEDYFDLQDPDGHLELSDIRLDTDVSGTGYTLSIL